MNFRDRKVLFDQIEYYVIRLLLLALLLLGAYKILEREVYGAAGNPLVHDRTSCERRTA